MKYNEMRQSFEKMILFYTMRIGVLKRTEKLHHLIDELEVALKVLRNDYENLFGENDKHE